MKVGCQHNALAALLPGKTQYPLYKRLDGPRGQSRWVRKILPPLGLDPQTLQPIASHYIDCAIPAHTNVPTVMKSPHNLMLYGVSASRSSEWKIQRSWPSRMSWHATFQETNYMTDPWRRQTCTTYSSPNSISVDMYFNVLWSINALSQIDDGFRCSKCAGDWRWHRKVCRSL
jgi:hypothetical protein